MRDERRNNIDVIIRMPAPRSHLLSADMPTPSFIDVSIHGAGGAVRTGQVQAQGPRRGWVFCSVAACWSGRAGDGPADQTAVGTQCAQIRGRQKGMRMGQRAVLHFMHMLVDKHIQQSRSLALIHL